MTLGIYNYIFAFNIIGCISRLVTLRLLPTHHSYISWQRNPRSHEFMNYSWVILSILMCSDTIIYRKSNQIKKKRGGVLANKND